MSKYILLGGTQKNNINTKNYKEWKGFAQGIVLELDTDTGQISEELTYVSPIENRVESDDASILFKAGEVKDNELLLCTQTEILIFDIETYQLKNTISLHCFNDVHHAFFMENGNYAAVSSGLDAVFEVDSDGNLLSELSVGDFNLWDKFDSKTDYRKVLTTKPHKHHPNFCFEYKGDLWATRFWDKDAINLNTRETLSIEVGNPHDGRVIGDNVYFTTVNGFIVKIHLPTGKKETFDMNPLNSTSKVLGWCRSIEVLDESRFIAGFSRMRTSKYRDYAQWLKRKIKSDAYPGNLPTRITTYNFESNKIEQEFNLEDYGMNAIFSILKK